MSLVPLPPELIAAIAAHAAVQGGDSETVSKALATLHQFPSYRYTAWELDTDAVVHKWTNATKGAIWAGLLLMDLKN